MIRIGHSENVVIIILTTPNSMSDEGRIFSHSESYAIKECGNCGQVKPCRLVIGPARNDAQRLCDECLEKRIQNEKAHG